MWIDVWFGKSNKLHRYDLIATFIHLYLYYIYRLVDRDFEIFGNDKYKISKLSEKRKAATGII